MPTEDSPQLVKPKFPQITETYGGSKGGDSKALLTRKTVLQPMGNAARIARSTLTEARVDVIFPDIAKEELNSGGFVLAEEEEIEEIYEKEEGKLIQKNIRKTAPLGSIASEEFPYSTARITSEETTEEWLYLNGVPIRREVTIRKPIVAVIKDYDTTYDFGLGRVVAEKQIETWELQSYSASESQYLHTTQIFKTRGELFPEYVAEFDNFTVALGLCLSPDSPEPEIVSVAPEPQYSNPDQPIEQSSEEKEVESSNPEEEPEYEPDQPLDPTQTDEDYNAEPPFEPGYDPDDPAYDPDSPEYNPEYDPTYDPDSEDYDPSPDLEADYEPDSPPWEAEEFESADNPDEIYLDDTPEDANLEEVAETATALNRARQFPYNITHPIALIDITHYQPLRRVHIAGMAFVRDGFAIALGEGDGGSKQLAVAYTGLLVGKLNEAGVAVPTYKKITTIANSVIVGGSAELIDPARETASSDSTKVLVGGTSTAIADSNWIRSCTGTSSNGYASAKAVQWVGASGSRTITVNVVAGANLLSQPTIYVLQWTQAPNTAFTGAVELTSLGSTGGSFSFNPASGTYLSFVVKVSSLRPYPYKRGLYFYAGGNGVMIHGR